PVRNIQHVRQPPQLSSTDTGDSLMAGRAEQSGAHAHPLLGSPQVSHGHSACAASLLSMIAVQSGLTSSTVPTSHPLTKMSPSYCPGGDARNCLGQAKVTVASMSVTLGGMHTSTLHCPRRRRFIRILVTVTGMR